MTGRRLVRRPISWGIVSRLERPEGVALAVVMAALAAVGWYASPFWLAITIAAELVVGGLGAVWIIGPATTTIGFARYATLAVSGVALTMFGRLTVGQVRANRTGRSGLGLELMMIGIVFGTAAGLLSLTLPDAWGIGIGLMLPIVAVPAVRAAESRQRYGAEAVGQALLHLLAVAQVATAVALLGTPAVVAAALIALAFHAWGGAAEALQAGAPGRAVALEFGALAVLGVVVAFLLQSP
jgi:hypothetical protein